MPVKCLQVDPQTSESQAVGLQSRIAVAAVLLLSLYMIPAKLKANGSAVTTQHDIQEHAAFVHHQTCCACLPAHSSTVPS
jgi:hypothetical protein